MKRLFLFALALALLLSGCYPLDAERRDAVRAFGEVLEALPPEGDGRADSGYWSITAPDGSARFEWDNQNIDMFVDTRAFNVPGREGIDFATGLIFFAPAFNMLNMGVQPTAIRQFEKDAGFVRDYIAYDAQTDRYGIELSGGQSRFEWARDMETNENDIVFALYANSLIAQGLDPLQVEGWEYDRAAERFIKTFNLV